MKNPHPINSVAYHDFNREQERQNTLYRTASVEIWVPNLGSHTIAALWPKGEPADQIARRFVTEACRKFGCTFESRGLHFMRPRVYYVPPLVKTFALVEGRKGN